MYNGSNWDRKSQLSEILTEPLNPRDLITILTLLEFCSTIFFKQSYQQLRDENLDKILLEGHIELRHVRFITEPLH